MKQKLSRVLVIMLLLGLVAGCRGQGQLQVVNSNLAGIDREAVTTDLEEVNLDFNQELKAADITLVRNGQEKATSKVQTNLNNSQLTITNLNLQPNSIYHLSVLLTSETGQQLLKTVKFITKRTEYPTVKEPNQTMMQAFYWYLNVNRKDTRGDDEYKPAKNYTELYPEEVDFWNLLADRADQLAEVGITALWVPPTHKGHERRDEGYGVYDIWDLGEFEQNGTVRTKYGTREQLDTMISKLHEQGIKVYYDIVMNHRIGGEQEKVKFADGQEARVRSDFTGLAGRQEYYNRADEFVWDWNCFDSIPYVTEEGGRNLVLFAGKEWDAAYKRRDYLLGADVDYQNSNVQHELKAWGQWIINDVGFDGFRIDAIKHVHTPYIEEWLREVQKGTRKDVFYVGEAWMDERTKLIDYLETVDYTSLTSFDFPLRFKLLNMSRAKGSFDLTNLSTVGLVNTDKYKDKAVTFVDNHDLQRDNSGTGLTDYEVQAYAYILMRESGLPTIFYKDYYHKDIKQELDTLLRARKYFAYGKGYEVSNNDADVYSYVRAGLDQVSGTGLVMMISDGSSGQVVAKTIDSRQSNTTFYDFTGHVKQTVTTDSQGRGQFKVKQSEADGWSIWVPIQQEMEAN